MRRERALKVVLVSPSPFTTTTAASVCLGSRQKGISRGVAAFCDRWGMAGREGCWVRDREHGLQFKASTFLRQGSDFRSPTLRDVPQQYKNF